MRNPKMNKSLWHVQGLIMLLCILSLIIATGTAEARYRAEKDAAAEFQVWEPAQIYLGTLSEETTETEGENAGEPAENVKFDPVGVPTWEESEGSRSMVLAVANGSSETAFYTKDQQFRLQMIGSLGLGTEAAFPKIELRVPSEEDPAIYEAFQGTASSIKEGTTLYHSVGAGWIIRFQNDEGQEPSWILKGDSLSYKRFIIIMENVLTDTDIMLQPQVEVKVVQE